MKVLVTGASGMLGRQVAQEYRGRGAEVYPLCRKQLDITDFCAVKNKLFVLAPDLVVNCAAYTDVDGAEDNPEAAFTVNGLAPRLLALACRQYSTDLVHVSTDYIFDGKSRKPYLVSDIPAPVNVYGTSKLIGEQGIKESGCRYYIIRTSWLFGPGGKNFAGTILSLAGERDTLTVVNDQTGCPTYTPDLARGLADLAGSGIYGTYHCTNSGVTSWYGFALKIIQLAGLSTKVEPCGSALYPRPARRPSYSVLDPFPLARVIGYTPPAWENAVERYVNSLY